MASSFKCFEVFGGSILYILGSELENDILINIKFYKVGASILFWYDSMEQKFETMSYVAS